MAGFVPVELVQPEPAGKMADTGRIDIRRGGGFTVSVDRLVDPQALRLVLEIVGELER
jgi:transposase